MNILIGTETYSPDVNGAARFTQRLAQGLQCAGHQVTVLAPAKRLMGRSNVSRELAAYRVPSLPIPGYPPYRMSVAALAHRFAEEVVDELQPDVIHIQNHFVIGRALTRVARPRGIPLVATNHFVPENFAVHIHLPQRMKRRAIAWAWTDAVRILNQATLVATPTRTAAALLRAWGLRVPVEVISGGVDLTEFHMDGSARSAPPVNGPRTCLYVGRLEPEKHVDDLIRALRIVRERMDARLIVVGVGSQLAPLRRLAKREHVDPYVVFSGFVPDAELPQYYRGCDVFCMASTAELQCLSAMEAMASGRPIIAADALALPELVQPGVNGYTFRPGDVTELAGRVLDCLANSAKVIRMGMMSREIIAQHAFDQTIAAYERCYQGLIARTAGRLTP